jgi:hypothetical protein
MTRREVVTAKVIDDAEELINDYVYLVERLIGLEAGMNSYYAPVITEILDEEAGV